MKKEFLENLHPIFEKGNQTMEWKRELDKASKKIGQL